jgi:SAM-dependent methyltransferase
MEATFYDRYADLEASHWWFVGRRAIVARAVERLPLRDDAPILEVGCGTGGMLQLLRRFGRTVGLDISLSALGAARDRGASCVTRGDSCRLPFATGSFAAVCAFDMLEHVEDDGLALRELHRVCRPGGRLIVSVPAFPFLWGRQDVVSHHYRRYVRRELNERLGRAGFVPEYTTYFNTWLFPAIAAIRVARAWLGGDADVTATDFDLQVPRPVNAALARLMASEAVAIGRWSLPVGVSLLAVATRRADGVAS